MNWPEITRIEALEGDADDAEERDRDLRVELVAVGNRVDEKLGKLYMAVLGLLVAIIASTVTLVLAIR